MVAELVQVTNALCATQLRVEEFAVEEEPRTADEPGHGRAARVVDQQRRFDALHEQRRQLYAAGAHLRQLSDAVEKFK